MLIFYLFKTREKVMKITQHTDSGIEKENEGPVSEERNLIQCAGCNSCCLLSFDTGAFFFFLKNRKHGELCSMSDAFIK